MFIKRNILRLFKDKLLFDEIQGPSPVTCNLQDTLSNQHLTVVWAELISSPTNAISQQECPIQRQKKKSNFPLEFQTKWTQRPLPLFKLYYDRQTNPQRLNVLPPPKKMGYLLRPCYYNGPLRNQRRLVGDRYSKALVCWYLQISKERSCLSNAIQVLVRPGKYPNAWPSAERHHWLLSA